MLEQCLFGICLLLWFCFGLSDELHKLNHKLKFVPPEGMELVKAIVIFRHGKRAPCYPHPFDVKDSDYEKQFFPDGYGKLVAEGKQQLFELGANLRSRYQDLLLPHTETMAKDLRVVSTKVDRCFISASLVIAGFYPPDQKQQWDDELQWQPIPIWWGFPDGSYITDRYGYCPGFDVELTKAFEVRENDSNWLYLKEYVERYKPKGWLLNRRTLYVLADYFLSKHSLGVELPDWADDNFLKRMSRYQIDRFQSYSYSVQQQRILSGRLIKDLVIRIREVMNDESTNSRFYFYSGHDTTIHSLMSTFGYLLDYVPHFGAAIVYEIYRSKDDKYFVRMVYNEDFTLENINVKKMFDCDNICPVEKFFEIVSSFVNMNWDKECSGEEVYREEL